MKKFQKLLIITTVIGSILGWNIHTTQAQNSLELIEISANTIDSIKDNSRRVRSLMQVLPLHQ